MMHLVRILSRIVVVRRRVLEALAIFCEEVSRARVLKNIIEGVLVVSWRTKSLLPCLRARAALLLHCS
jgi:hypothetical protein